MDVNEDEKSGNRFDQHDEFDETAHWTRKSSGVDQSCLEEECVK